MTYAEFLEKLRETPRDWTIREWGNIRRGIGGHPQCPISALCDLDAGSVSAAARGLNLGKWRHIAMAADNNTDCQMRRDLLEACGLS
jgi:hypothetical protein